MSLACAFRTISEHITSLGLVRYQACPCGRLRVLLDTQTVAEARRPPGPAPEGTVRCRPRVGAR
jgi:hypothetical protein